MIEITAETNSKDFEIALLPEMEKPIEHLKKELIKIRTGRANPAMLDGIRVACYGSEMPLKELGIVSAPDARLLVIQPWDKSVIADIEKAILASDLGVNPTNDGEVVRIQLPQMSQERRVELAKVLSKKLEECRTAIRNVRKDFQNAVREAEKSHKISEDFAKRLLVVLQDHTDKHTATAENLAKKKEEEIKA